MAGIAQWGFFLQSAAPKSRLSQIQNLFKSMGVFSININRSWLGSRELSDPEDVFWVSADTLQGEISNSFGFFFQAVREQERFSLNFEKFTLQDNPDSVEVRWSFAIDRNLWLPFALP